MSEKTDIRLIKILIIFSYLLFTSALINLAINAPVFGYELSIYSSIPFFWVLIILAVFIAMSVIVFQAYIKIFAHFWLAFLILFLSSLIIFLVPIFRGYFIYGGNDPFAHLKTTNLIIADGHFTENYYPIIHILGAVLVEISSLRLETVIKLLSPLFSMIYMLFTYYLALVVSKRRDCATIAAATGSIPLYAYFHVTVYPHMIATFLLPLVFYLYFKSSDFKYYSLLMIMLILLPFTHAVPSLILIACLVSAWGALRICKIRELTPQMKISVNPALISFLTWFTWWSTNAAFRRIIRVYNWLFGELKEIPRTAEVIPIFELGRSLWLELFLKMYGIQLLYTILFIISLVIVVVYFSKKKSNYSYLFILSVVILTSGILYVLMYLSAGFMTFGRFLGANIGIWATPVFVAFIFSKINIKKIGILLVTTILILSFSFGVVNIYRSPWILQPNWHFTYHDYSAFCWEAKHPAESSGYAWTGSPLGRAPLASWKWTAREGIVYIPPNFNYGTNNILRQSLPVDTVIFLGESRQIMASKNPILINSPIAGLWTYPGLNDNDALKLEYDPSVYIYYSNGENKFLLVK